MKSVWPETVRDPAAERLRVVVFTAGPLIPVNRVFFERLAWDPSIDLRGIVVDEYRKPRKSLLSRAARGIRSAGWSWVTFQAASKAEALARRVLWSVFERTHPRSSAGDPHEALERSTGVRVFRVPDIHSATALGLIRSLAPQLGVIVGGRILKESVISIPELGTLNIHKRKVPEYRGGGPVGYWELLAGESEIGVTVHYAVAAVDAGAVLAEASIPIEECDTLESLQIKADIAGAELYLDTIHRFAAGCRRAKPQDLAIGRTYRQPTDAQLRKHRRDFARRARRRMPSSESLPSWLTRARLLAQYALVFPFLYRLRKTFENRRHAPVCVFFYHVVSNRPVNHMALPLEEFARQMEFLQRYYAILALPEAVERLSSGHNDSIAAVITFDDGYRDNTWAIRYLRYFGIPATFFVSTGNIRDERRFEHDLRRGFKEALPMTPDQVRRLAEDRFCVGSHGVFHEDFGALDRATAESVLRESRDWIHALTGQVPRHFSFPKGHRKNITREALALAEHHYGSVYSAYGGYNFPGRPGRHFLRIPHPYSVLELALMIDGYGGLRECMRGNAWGLRTAESLPY
jgi:peptidoglycan/xylan/chitin deacetylase (PgdA/CDA1 family)